MIPSVVNFPKLVQISTYCRHRQVVSWKWHKHQSYRCIVRPVWLLRDHRASSFESFALVLYRQTGGRASLFHFILLRNHSTASCTPVPVKALQGNTLLSLTLPPFSPSNTLRTNPSFILTTSTQSSLSCLLAKTSSGTPSASSLCSTSSSTSRHSSSLPSSISVVASLLLLASSAALSPELSLLLLLLARPASCAISASPTSVLSITNTIAWQEL